MAKNNVLVNGLSAVTAGSSGILMTSPDVCNTTCGPATVPIPYPNIAESKDLADGSTSVMIEGNPVCLESSTFAKSTGDEGGDKKGTASGTIQDEAKPGLFSPTVFIEGKAIVRNTDIFTSNKMNTPPAPVMQAQVGPGVGTIPDHELLQRPYQRVELPLETFGDDEHLAKIMDQKVKLVIKDKTTGKVLQEKLVPVEDPMTSSALFLDDDQEIESYILWPHEYQAQPLTNKGRSKPSAEKEPLEIKESKSDD
jgi:hypothetical protein